MKGVARPGQRGGSCDTTPGDLGRGNPPAWGGRRGCAPGVRAGSPRLAPGGRSSDGPALPLRGAGARSALAGPPRRALCGHAVRRAGDAALLCQPSRYPSWRSAGTEGKGRALSPGPRPPPDSAPAERAHAAPSAERSHQAPRRAARGRGRKRLRVLSPRAQGAGAGAAGRPAWGVAAPGAGPWGRARARGGRGPRRGAGTWPPGLRSSGGRRAGSAPVLLSARGPRGRSRRSCAPLRGRRRAAAGRWAWCGGARCGGGPGGPGARLPQAARAGGAGRGAAGVLRGRRVVRGRWDSASLGRAVLGVHLPPQGVSVRMGRAFGWRTSHPSTRTQRSGCGGRYGGHPGVRSGRTCRPCPLEELRQTGDWWTRGGPPRR